MLIIAGGRGDPDLNWLADAAKHRDLPYLFCYCNSSEPTQIHWDIQSNTLTLNDTIIESKSSCIYLRYSMYDLYGEASTEDAKILAESHYEPLKSWALYNEGVGMLNRHMTVGSALKLYLLIIAEEFGFKTPRSIITNITEKPGLTEEKAVIKTVNDGLGTAHYEPNMEPLDPPHLFKARPWVIQEQLDYPELRIFRVGPWLFAFEINAQTIDSRIDDTQSLKHVDVPDYLKDPMMKLTDHLQVDFAAADFKSCSKTGKFVFLEINNGATFSGYDAVAEGRVSDAMVLHLKRLATTHT
jgi:hypothetical protein